MSVMEMNEIIGTLNPLIEYNGGGINSLIEKGTVRSVQRGTVNQTQTSEGGPSAQRFFNFTIPISSIQNTAKTFFTQVFSANNVSESGGITVTSIVLEESTIVVQAQTKNAVYGNVTVQLTGDWQIVEFY